MNRVLLFSFFLYFPAFSFSQNFSRSNNPRSTPLASKAGKPALDSAAVSHWKYMSHGGGVSISNDGKYCTYAIGNKPMGRITLVIQSTTNSWKLEFPGASPGFFSWDSKQYIFQMHDTLCYLQVGTNTPRFVPGIASYKKASVDRAGGKDTESEWLAFQLRDSPKELVVQNLITGYEKHFDSVADYEFSRTGKTLVLKTHTMQKASGITSLLLVNLPEGETATVWSSEDNKSTLNGYVVDDDGEQVAFLLQEVSEDGKNKQPSHSIWYYKKGMPKAVLKVNDHTAGIERGLFVQGGPTFMNGGKYILFSLQQRPDLRKPGPNAVNLDVWGYRDTILQTRQLHESPVKSYAAVISTNGNNVVRLVFDHKILEGYNGDYALIRGNRWGDRFWEKDYGKYSNWLVSMKDGSGILLKTRAQDISFSPGGKYLVYFDTGRQCNYFSYDLQTGKEVNISRLVPACRLGYKDEFKPLQKKPLEMVGIAGWLEHDAGLLVYDNYDIWLLDPAGKTPPVNITNGYGRLHHITFRLTWSSMIFSPHATALLTAFNPGTKYNGFYQMTIGEKGDPKLLYMGPYVFDLDGYMLPRTANHNFDEGMTPLKAKEVDCWIVERESFAEAPNFFLTSDFTHYKQLTNLQPQSEYNWLTAELVSFRQADGTRRQGILYKPENFDPAKKYPILFTYYQQMSHRLYQYPYATFMNDANIDIARFVSRGYLVFTPDIYFMGGRMGQSAYNAVVGAARYLSKLPYVDGNRMGIAGHSFGGRLTNYIVTHTTLFAAAFEGAGVSDEISASLQLGEIEGMAQGSRLGYQETSYTGEGVSLWERPSQWMDESPILKADQVKTPLLIFHCKEDIAVPWAQGVEMFIALRRLNKKAWMLQYDKGGHEVEGNDVEDLTIRATQFFDHYLKGAPAPKWMTEGIPARLKGIETGYELDSSGKKP